MKPYTWSFLIIICLLLTSAFALAAPSKDFVISSKTQTLELCSCQTFQDSWELYNVGDQGTWYKIETTSPYAELDDPIIYLERGGSATIPVTLTIPCSAEEATSYTLRITSYQGYAREVTKKLTLENCQNLKAALVPDESLVAANNTIKPCEKASFTLYVQNIGPFEEAYTYTVLNQPGINGSFRLAPRETRHVPLSITPDCALYGQHPVKVKVTTTGSDRTATLTIPLRIEQDYAFALSLPEYINESVEVCRYGVRTIPVTLTNLVDVPNTYTLSLFAPKVVSLNTTMVSLEGKATKTIPLFVNPQGRTGTWTVVVNAATALGDASANTSLVVNTYTCYDVRLVLDALSEQSCTDNTYTATITNQADIAQEITLDSSHEFVTLDTPTLILEPGEERMVPVQVTNPKDDTTHTIQLTATIDGQQQATTSFTYRAVSDYDCTKVWTDQEKIVIHNDTLSATITLDHVGIEADLYELELDAPEWTSVNITAFELAPDQSFSVVLDFINLSTVAPGDYPVMLTLTADETGQEYTYTITLQFREKTDLHKAFDRVVAFFAGSLARTVLFFLLCSLVLILILLLIIKATAPKYPYKVTNKIKKKKGLLLFLIALFLFTVAVVYGITGLPYVPSAEGWVEPQEGPRRITWAEDTAYQFNLSEHVMDPDMDALFFEVSPLEHIQADIQGNIVVFVPEKDWHGEETVFFTATDAFGESTTSEPITLEVVNVPEFTFWEYFKPWIWTVNLLMFLLILAAFYTIFIVHNRRKNNGKKKKSA